MLCLRFRRIVPGPAGMRSCRSGPVLKIECNEAGSLRRPPRYCTFLQHRHQAKADNILSGDQATVTLCLTRIRYHGR